VPEKYDWIITEEQWLRDGVSAVRSWVVYCDEFAAPFGKSSRPAIGVELLLSAAENQRVLQRKQARSAVNSARYTKFILGLSTWLNSDIWRDSAATSKAMELSEPARKF